MRRLLRGCGCAVLVTCAVLVVLAVVVYLAVGLSRRGELEDHEDEARAVVAKGDAQRAQVASARDRLRPRIHGLGAPVRSWSAVSCGLGHDDAGWIVQSYHQSCRAVAIDLYAADGLSAAQAARALGATERDPGLDICPAALEVPGLAAALGASGSSAPSDSSGPSVGIAWHPADPPATEEYCAPPAPHDHGDDPTDAYVDRTVDLPTTADAYVAVTVSIELDDVDLGCHPWKIPFCEEPVGSPVLPGG